MERKTFLETSLAATGALICAPPVWGGAGSRSIDALDPTLVFEFVRAGHNDIQRVREMLEKTPALLNATWDWGNGDFETALGGAGHVGTKPIAKYLIACGARADIFVLTMLGKNHIVVSLLEEFPNLLRSRGPHGFTLLHHAIAGGAESAELAEHVRALGLTETKLPL